ncbi:MAG: CTP synthase [Chitinophagales bacterium]
MAKHIFVTGGVTSSLGKGIIASSLGKLLQARGFRVTIQKFDPYLNVDPGTLNPYEHGECFVTNDGAETDLDLGHYERFLNVPTSQENNVTTGSIYQTVIDNERKGKYLGKTVQVIPHITDEIKRRVKRLGNKGEYDIIITELGGTVGDIESLPYVETLRQLKWEEGQFNCIVVHLTLLPYLNAAKELKTKPTQHSVRELSRNGVQPDIIVCRTEHHVTPEIRQKIARFCNVESNAVIEAIDADTIYDVPMILLREKLDRIILDKLRLPSHKQPDMLEWKRFLGRLKNPTCEVNIGLVGKYVELQDAYKSIQESFVHAGASNECLVNVISIHSEYINDLNVAEKLKDLDGVLVAPGFGSRGIEGKIKAIRYVREQKIPFLGICLGMQCAVVEFARNVLELKGADSIEMNENTEHPVVGLMEEQKNLVNMGGTMRLGSYKCEVKKKSKSYKAYKSAKISERHRHRYEFNNDYLSQFEEAGLNATGINPDTELVEIVELNNHPWFVGVQFHPELKSTVTNAHPLFIDFVKGAIEYRLTKN